MFELRDAALALFSTVGGTLAFVSGFGALRTWRLLRDTPTARVRSMAMGFVELSGQVEPRSELAAPFSGRRCVWWEVEISTLSGRSRGRTSWHVVHRRGSGHPFYLRDETGVALVYPEGANVKLNFTTEESTHGLGVPDPYMQYMEEQNLGMRRVWALGSMRFRERTLEAPQRVFVLGRAHPRPMTRDVSFDDLELAATGTDAPRAVAARVSREPAGPFSERDAEVKGVIRRGGVSEPFLIGQRSEAELVLEYGVRAFGGLLLGPPLAVFGLWCALEVLRAGR
ncbi:MAG: GIDE domain-containing protein [Candidatus Eisenbacteria bacterium]